MGFGSSARLALSLIVLLLALDYSKASDYEGIGKRNDEYSLLNIDFDGTSADVNGRKNLWGRKMLQELDEKPSYASGKAKPVSHDKYFTKTQKGKEHFNSQKAGYVSSKGLRVASGGNEEVALSNHDYFVTKKVENSKAFLAAADEVANLMRKDYKGQDRPKRKPPINNHEPTN